MPEQPPAAEPWRDATAAPMNYGPQPVQHVQPLQPQVSTPVAPSDNAIGPQPVPAENNVDDAPDDVEYVQSGLDEQLPEYVLPKKVESAVVDLPEDPALAAQRERTVAWLDRGVLILSLVALVMLAIALLNTFQGQASLFGWLLPLGLFALAGLSYYALHRIDTRSLKSVEVPVSLSEDLTEAVTAREELELHADEILDEDEYEAMLEEVDALLDEAAQSAKAALKAERAADERSAARSYEDTLVHIDDILDIRDEIFAALDLEDEYVEDFDDDYPDRNSMSAPPQERDDGWRRPPDQPGWVTAPLPPEPGVVEPPPVIRPEPAPEDAEPDRVRGVARPRHPGATQGQPANSIRKRRSTTYRPTSPDTGSE